MATFTIKTITKKVIEKITDLAISTIISTTTVQATTTITTTTGEVSQLRDVLNILSTVLAFVVFWGTTFIIQQKRIKSLTRRINQVPTRIHPNRNIRIIGTDQRGSIDTYASAPPPYS
jgi:hypothetical protein